MDRLFRVIAALVLAAAVPLQGLAAATMATCRHGPVTSAPGAAMAPHGDAVAVDAAHAHGMHQQGLAMVEGMTSAMSEDMPAATQAAPPAPAEQATPGCERHDGCATCCAPMAAAPASTAAATGGLQHVYAPAVPMQAATFLTAAPDRPPRPLLA